MNRKKIFNEVKLKSIANLSSGLVINRIDSLKSIDDNSNKYYYISQKSVYENYIDEGRFEPVFAEKTIENRYLARNNDIIMKLTPPYTVAMIDFNRNNLIIPSSFAIIRARDEFIPMYLAYVLNGKSVRQQLKRLVEGTNIPVIKINNLNNVKIKKVSKYKQIKYSKLFYLLDYRRRLLDTKRKLEESLKEGILSKL